MSTYDNLLLSKDTIGPDRPDDSLNSLSYRPLVKTRILDSNSSWVDPIEFNLGSNRSIWSS